MKSHRAVAVLALLAGLALMLRGSSTLQIPTGTWQSVGTLSVPRSDATATLLPDGRILFVGGRDADGNALQSAEVFNGDGSFTSVPSMSTPRYAHAAVLIPDSGYVLVTGGRTNGGGAVNTAEMFDSVANSWTTVPQAMVEARSGHTMSLLPNYKVLIAGGENSSGLLSALEAFDLSTMCFKQVGVLATARKGHAAVALADNRVLITGGSAIGSDGNAVVLASTEIFDPATGSVSPGPAMSTPRAQHTATTLLDGTVAIIGGSNGAADLASAEIFNPATNAITAVSSQLITARSGHQAFLLPKNNNVLIVGGTSAGQDLASAELYAPWTGQFSATAAMTAARSNASGAPMSGAQTSPGLAGLLVVAGGSNQQSGEAYGFATVKTDRIDYLPGETVTISGTGWKPGETVTLLLVESPNVDTHPSMTAVADASGNIYNDQFSPDEHDLTVHFYLTAVGSESQAQTSFSDGTVTAAPVATFDADCSTAASSFMGGTTVCAKVGPAAVNGQGNLHVQWIDPSSNIVHDTTYQVVDGQTVQDNYAPTTSGMWTLVACKAGASNPPSACGQNNVLSSVQITITNPKATPTLSVTNSPATYSGSTQAATVTGSVSGTVSNVKYNGSSTVPSNAGTYAITADFTPTDTTHYNSLTGATAGDFVIQKATPTLSVTNSPVTYNGSAQAATVTGSVGGTVSNIKYNGTATVPTNAATYAITADFTPADSTNYNSLTGATAGNFAIEKATPTLSISNSPVTYNGSAQAAAVSGSVAGTVTNVKYDGNSSVPTNAGTYAVTADFAPTDSTNYNTLTGASAGNFVIQKATPTLSISNSPVTYNGSAQAAAVSGSVAGTVTNVKYDGNSSVPTNAGTYAVTADFAPTDNTNYNNLTGASAGNFVIEKATPTLSVTNSGVIYNGSPQAANFTSSVPGNISNVKYGTSTTAPTNAGTYTVTADFAPTDSTNYNTLTGASAGNFVIQKANATISVTGYNVVFDGNSHIATATATGVNDVDLSANVNLANTAHTNVGDYNDAWSFSGGTNYNNASGTVHDVITAWTLTGFYQPVTTWNPTTPTPITWNTVKAGSTVPVKFNISAGALQKTDPSAVQGSSIAVYQVACVTGVASDDITDYLTNTGQTALRFDSIAGQFIQNWQTMKNKAGSCYMAQMTALDGSYLRAYFQLK